MNDIAFLNMIMVAQAKTGIVCAGIESLKATLNKIEEYGGTEYSFMRDAL